MQWELSPVCAKNTSLGQVSFTSTVMSLSNVNVIFLWQKPSTDSVILAKKGFCWSSLARAILCQLGQWNNPTPSLLFSMNTAVLREAYPPPLLCQRKQGGDLCQQESLFWWHVPHVHKGAMETLLCRCSSAAQVLAQGNQLHFWNGCELYQPDHPLPAYLQHKCCWCRMDRRYSDMNDLYKALLFMATMPVVLKLWPVELLWGSFQNHRTKFPERWGTPQSGWCSPLCWIASLHSCTVAGSSMQGCISTPDHTHRPALWASPTLGPAHEPAPHVGSSPWTSHATLVQPTGLGRLNANTNKALSPQEHNSLGKQGRILNLVLQMENWEVRKPISKAPSTSKCC